MIKTDKDWSQPVFCSPVQLMANWGAVLTGYSLSWGHLGQKTELNWTLKHYINATKFDMSMWDLSQKNFEKFHQILRWNSF
jgi:hypothetical protein